MESASRLYAETFGISTAGVTREQILSLASATGVPVFKPREGVKIATTDQEAQEMGTGPVDLDPTQSVADGLKALKVPQDLSISPLEFEKVLIGFLILAFLYLMLVTRMMTATITWTS